MKKIETDKNAGLREINFLKKLNHPNIIKIKHSFKQKKKIFLIMEKAECKIKSRLSPIHSFKKKKKKKNSPKKQS